MIVVQVVAALACPFAEVAEPVVAPVVAPEALVVPWDLVSFSLPSSLLIPSEFCKFFPLIGDNIPTENEAKFNKLHTEIQHYANNLNNLLLSLPMNTYRLPLFWHKPPSFPFVCPTWHLDLG